MDYKGITQGGSLAMVGVIGDVRAELTELGQRLELSRASGEELRQQVLGLEELFTRKLAALGARLDQVEYLVSEEIGWALTAPLREGGAQLGPGGRRARAVCARQIADACGPNAGNGEANFIHSPGYPQNATEIAFTSDNSDTGK